MFVMVSVYGDTGCFKPNLKKSSAPLRRWLASATITLSEHDPVAGKLIRPSCRVVLRFYVISLERRGDKT